MRSLRVKFTALLVSLLVMACLGLALVATQHERAALETEVEKRGLALAASLAGAAKEPLLLGVEQGDFDGDLDLVRLMREVGAGDGVVAVRLLGREGRVVASLNASERGQSPKALTGAEARPAADRQGYLLLAAAPILYSKLRVGEAQVELDLRVLVDPVVKSNTRRLALAATVLTLVGVAAGVVFVALLVGPLRRLRLGVERLTAGDVTVRVAATSLDEVGQLTRAFNKMGDSLLKKQRIENAFGRYVNDYVLRQVLDGPESEQLEGMEREVSVLFADIRGFTRLSEGMKARDVVALLNELFQLVTDCILERGGTVDKFIGDSVMAYFGAPVAHSDHPLRALLAGVDILRALDERNESEASDPDAPPRVRVQMGIGIHTGSVVVGNIGSDRRTDFTVIGDVVNVAHRLEKLSGPGEILVSQAVQRRVRAEVRLHFRGEQQLSGREEPVHVYSVDRSREPARRAAQGPSAS